MGERLDILIRGGTALTLSPGTGEILERADIGIARGRIVFARQRGTGPPPPDAPDVIEAGGFLVMPGLVNTHTHLPMTCFRGMADDLPLREWLTDHIFPAEARLVTPGFCAAGSLLGMIEMIMSGTTTVCDSYFFPDSIAAVALESGMRAVICAGFADFPVPGIPDPAGNVALAEAFLDRWTGLSDRLKPALFCHAPYTCSPGTMQAIKDVARRRNALFMTHLAETRGEVEETRARYGMTPLRHCHRLGLLDEKTVLAHCVWLDDGEIDVLAGTGAAVSHCPESNMKLAAGIAPVADMRARGITVGLGTDGAASNNDLDLFGEMAAAAGIHRLARGDPRVMDGRTVLKMATLDGARLLGLDGEIGSLEPGKRADIILVETRTPGMTPLGDPFEALVRAPSGSGVSTVIIDGRVVMRNRVLTSIDPLDAMERVRSLLSMKNGSCGEGRRLLR